MKASEANLLRFLDSTNSLGANFSTPVQLGKESLQTTMG